MNRKPIEDAAPDHRSSSVATPRLYDPDGPCDEIAPEVAPCLINGRPYRLLVWTAQQWTQLSGNRRPGDAFEGSGGSWFRFEIDVG